jgi:hypothetical protein
MAAYNKFQDFSEQLTKGVHQFGTHTFKVVLTNTAPVATNTVLSNITQISNGNGYTTGGATVPNVAVSESSGTTTVVGDAVTWTATGAVGPFRYVVLYNDSAASDNLVAWWDYGASGVTLASGETFTWKPSYQSTGGTLFTLA